MKIDPPEDRLGVRTQWRLAHSSGSQGLSVGHEVNCSHPNLVGDGSGLWQCHSCQREIYDYRLASPSTTATSIRTMTTVTADNTKA
jgi:hypothetical protein